MNIGGAEKLLVDVVKSWSQQPSGSQIQVTVYALLDGPLRHELEAAGCRVVVARHHSGRIAPATVFWLLHHLRRDKIDLVHAHLPRAGVYSRLAAAMLRIPVVYTEHNLWDRYSRISGVLNRLTFRLNSHVFAVSGAVLESVNCSRKCPPITVVRNGISSTPTESLAEPRRIMGLKAADVVIGTVANLHPKKGLDVLLRATKLILEEFPDLYCVLIGRDDGDGHRLASIAEDLQINSRLLWMGCRQDARSLIRGLDIFVLPSHFEGLPIALLEAMEAGVPTVATSVGGIPEVIVHGKTGVLVRKGDVAGLSTAITALLQDPEQRRQIGTAARNHIHQMFNVDRTASAYLEQYFRLVNQHD